MKKLYPIDRLNYAAIVLLEDLGILTPTESQVNAMECVLSTVGLKRDVKINPLLSRKQQDCLYWTAHGYDVEKTAKQMGVAPSTVSSHREAIKKRLDCHSMAHAVYKGIFMDYIIPETLVKQIINVVKGESYEHQS